LIESNPGSPVLIEDLCRVAGMCERTLRSVFQEYFGVPPMRLLRAKQLWDVRAALLGASPEHDTVKKVAARFGVWDLSLFAHNYRELFAELPSVTLRSRIKETPHRPGLTWLKFAAEAAKRE
jgi:AraC family ethanolamine operon transcriptional activator